MTVDYGSTINFAGTASDAEDGDLTASLAWSSDLDGAIGTGGSVSTSLLTVGTHTISAAATDSGGLSDSAAITVTVLNTAPTATIIAPTTGLTVDYGSTINFAGTASDAEDGDLTASLAWSSDLDGAIGTGGSVSTSLLTVGTHTISAAATDSGGLSDNAAITVTVLPAGGSSTVEARVAAGTDDAEETSSGSIKLTSSDLEFVFDGVLVDMLFYPSLSLNKPQ